LVVAPAKPWNQGGSQTGFAACFEATVQESIDSHHQGHSVKRSAVLVGTTGLVGGRLLSRLLAHPDYDRVVAWVRRPVSLQIHKFSQLVVDFDRLAEYAAQFDAQDVYVALGTTIKQAGSREAFRRVDFDYPLEIARIAKARGAQRFLLVTALGADARSRVFYSRVKGEVEEAVASVDIPRTWFFRPSLLVGARKEDRRAERFGNAVGKVVGPFLVGGLRKYRPIAADAVAAAMVYAVTHDIAPGVIESDRIARLATKS
jgi:uncharacterized protein YbjT (DUF2867 family)